MKKGQSYLSTVQWFNLYHCLERTAQLTFYNGFYLVGSAMIHKDFRDIDIRTVVPFDLLKSNDFTRKSISMWYSEWLTNRINFTVDFQIQSKEEFESYKGPRLKIGESY